MIDYLAQNLWQVWAVIAVLCLILEMTSGDCFIICFSFGAIVAAIAAAVGLNGYIQLAAFAVFTLVFLFWFRPLAKRYLHKGEDNRVSNADALLGRKRAGWWRLSVPEALAAYRSMVTSGKQSLGAMPTSRRIR